MSPPSANIRSSTPIPSDPKDDAPSTAGEAHLSSRFSLSVAIQSPSASEPTDLSVARKEILKVLMNPHALKDKESRDAFALKLSQYSKLVRLDQSDVLLSIASTCFDMKTYKIVIIGNAGVGKSSFVARLKQGNFQVKIYKPTQGAEVTAIVIPTSEGFPIMFELWDIAGNGKVSS